MNSADLKDARDILLDREAFLSLAKELVDYADRQAWQGCDAEVRRLFRHWSGLHLKSSIEKVFRHAQSPIEKIFLNSLLIMGFWRSPFFLIFTPRFASITETLAYVRQRGAEIAEARTRFEAATGLDGPRVFLDAIEEADDIPRDVKEAVGIDVVLMDGMRLRDRFHVSVQSGLQELAVANRGVRPDIFVWVPSRPEFRLVVECDGYAFHSDRATFSRDRRRDRVLKGHGYDVLRFAGTEIFHDPPGVALELIEYLDREQERLELEL